MTLLNAAAAQTACPSIQNDLDRLACYDRESGRTPAVENLPTESAWEVNVEKSEMTDETTVLMRVGSVDSVRCSFSGEEKPTLIVRCMENTTSIYITTNGCHLVSSDYNDYGDITYRIDDDSAKTQAFTESTNNRALGLWRGGEAIPFIRSLFGGSSLLMRFTPFNESPVTARFPIAGLDEAVAPLREACGW
jgi:type VI secretion system protein VasI